MDPEDTKYETRRWQKKVAVPKPPNHPSKAQECLKPQYVGQHSKLAAPSSTGTNNPFDYAV